MVDEKNEYRHDGGRYYFAPTHYNRVVPYSHAFDTEEQAWAGAREYAERNKDMIVAPPSGSLH